MKDDKFKDKGATQNKFRESNLNRYGSKNHIYDMIVYI